MMQLDIENILIQSINKVCWSNIFNVIVFNFLFIYRFNFAFYFSKIHRIRQLL